MLICCYTGLYSGKHITASDLSCCEANLLSSNVKVRNAATFVRFSFFLSNLLRELEYTVDVIHVRVKHLKRKVFSVASRSGFEVHSHSDVTHDTRQLGAASVLLSPVCLDWTLHEK
jgi:hypothetical protein